MSCLPLGSCGEPAFVSPSAEDILPDLSGHLLRGQAGGIHFYPDKSLLRRLCLDPLEFYEPLQFPIQLITLSAPDAFFLLFRVAGQPIGVNGWIERVAQLEDAGLVALDGQVRPTVILDAAREAGFSDLHFTLIECSHGERRRRLVEARAQPELDKLDMYAWAAYLRGQADALQLEIIDTTSLSLKEAIDRLAGSIGHFAGETGIDLDRTPATRLDLQP